jgi:hypothetical protein
MKFIPSDLIVSNCVLSLTKCPGPMSADDGFSDPNDTVSIIESNNLVLVVATHPKNAGLWDEVLVLTSSGDFGWQVENSFRFAR